VTDSVVSVGVESDIIRFAESGRRLDGVRAQLDGLVTRARSFGRSNGETRGQRESWWKRDSSADQGSSSIADMLVARFGSIEQLRDAADSGDVNAKRAHTRWVEVVTADARSRGEDPLSLYYFSTPTTVERLQDLDIGAVASIIDKAFHSADASKNPKLVLFDGNTANASELQGTHVWSKAFRRGDAIVVLDRQSLLEALDDAGLADRPEPLTLWEAESLFSDELAILATRVCNQAFARRANVLLDTSISSLLHDPALISASANDSGLDVYSFDTTARGLRLTEVRHSRLPISISAEERASLDLAREVASLRYGAGGEGGLSDLFTEIDGLRSRMVNLERVARILGEFGRNRRGRHSSPHLLVNDDLDRMKSTVGL